MASYIGKYKVMQKRYIDTYFRFVYDPIHGMLPVEVEQEQPKEGRKKRKKIKEE